jgi:hypothetical protein
MRDFWDGYGYSQPLMVELAEHPIASRVNTGICGLRSDFIDWERVEHWCKIMLEREGPSYFQEQALSAMLMGQDVAYAPADQYKLVRTAAEAAAPVPAVLRHYVMFSRPYYYHRAWYDVFPSNS